MKVLNEKVVNMLGKEMWFLCSGEEKPAVSVAAFKEITNDGKLVFPVFYDKEFVNAVNKSGKIAISVSDGRIMQGYQIKGKAEYATDGLMAEKWKEVVKKHLKSEKPFMGVIEVIPDKVTITTPGRHNNEEI